MVWYSDLFKNFPQFVKEGVGMITCNLQLRKLRLL